MQYKRKLYLRPLSCLTLTKSITPSEKHFGLQNVSPPSGASPQYCLVRLLALLRVNLSIQSITGKGELQV